MGAKKNFGADAFGEQWKQAAGLKLRKYAEASAAGNEQAKYIAGGELLLLATQSLSPSTYHPGVSEAKSFADHARIVLTEIALDEHIEVPHRPSNCGPQTSESDRAVAACIRHGRNEHYAKGMQALTRKRLDNAVTPDDVKQQVLAARKYCS